MASTGMTVSLPHGYGNGVEYPAATSGLSVADAAYQTVHHYKSRSGDGVRALAEKLGMSANTLTHKLNPNTATHHLSLEEAMCIMEQADNVAILQAAAARLGFTISRATPMAHEGAPLDVMAHFYACVGDLSNSAADALRSGTPSNNEIRRAENHAQEVQAACGHVLGLLRSLARKPAPGGPA